MYVPPVPHSAEIVLCIPPRLDTLSAIDKAAVARFCDVSTLQICVPALLLAVGCSLSSVLDRVVAG